MVVRIRLARWGASNNPFFGIVAANHRAARDGKHLERLGTYNPVPDDKGIKHLELDSNRIKYWLGVGAQPSDRVAWLLSKADILPMKPKLLQHLGLVDMMDSKTWKVRVTDKIGNQLALISSEEAELTYSKTPLKNQLPTGEKPPVLLNRLDPQSIEFDGSRKGKLEEKDALLVLKTYLGI